MVLSAFIELGLSYDPHYSCRYCPFKPGLRRPILGSSNQELDCCDKTSHRDPDYVFGEFTTRNFLKPDLNGYANVYLPYEMGKDTGLNMVSEERADRTTNHDNDM